MPQVRKERGERLRFARLLMVLSSLAPLFVLMAIRGNCLFPEVYFVAACLALAILPSMFLWWRVRNARRQNDTRPLVTGPTEDHRGHVLVYLFATLLPFYREEIGNYRDLLAMCAALGLIVFLFWRLNLHYHEPVLRDRALPGIHGVAAGRRESVHWTGEFRADHTEKAIAARREVRRLSVERHRLLWKNCHDL